MITNLKEGGKVKCERYWPEEGSCEYGPFRVTMSNQLVYPDYTTRTLQVSVSAIKVEDVYVCVHMCVHVCVCVYMCMCVYVCMCVCACVCVCVVVYVCRCVYM